MIFRWYEQYLQIKFPTSSDANLKMLEEKSENDFQMVCTLFSDKF